MTSDALSLFATWALAHELADQEYRAAVERGSGTTPGEGRSGSVSDRLFALIDEEKERLKARLDVSSAPPAYDLELEETLAEMRFEMSALRARLETIESSLDAILAKLG